MTWCKQRHGKNYAGTGKKGSRACKYIKWQVIYYCQSRKGAAKHDEKEGRRSQILNLHDEELLLVRELFI